MKFMFGVKKIEQSTLPLVTYAYPIFLTMNLSKKEKIK